MKKILIIEDDPVITHIYMRQFQAEGFQVMLAPSGEVAIEILKRTRPDLAVLDLQLPKISGIDVLKFLRANPLTATVPVVVFSNSYLGTLVDAAWKAGANKCLTKTICTPRQLLETVRQTLANPTPAVVNPSAAVAPKASPKTPTKVAAAVKSVATVAVPVAPVAAPITKPTTRLPKAPIEEEPPLPAPTKEDKAFEKEVRRTFLAEAPQHMATLRHLLHAFVLNESDKATTRWMVDRSRILRELLETAHTLNRQSSVAGMRRIARITSALEALLKTLFEKPNQVNPSTLRTVSHAVDFLETLAECADKPESEMVASVLAVDDDPISRRAVLAGLEKAGLQALSLGDPYAALERLGATKFDLIFLDVDMPRLNGYELCVKLRAMAPHKKTPVVFVTSLSDFESSARSSISGGNDLIAKPILPIELSVKALMYVIKGEINAVTKAV